MKQTIIWTLALAVGVAVGLLGVGWIDQVADFVASVYTRLFRLLAVPTILLAVITTLATLGTGNTGRILSRTVFYTLLTTVLAAAVAAALYVAVAPGNIASAAFSQPADAGAPAAQATSYYEHILSVVPDNVVRPLLEGNVLSLLLVAFAVGFGLSRLRSRAGASPVSRHAVETLTDVLVGLQELLHLLIRAVIRTLPLGIAAYAAQLARLLSAGIVADSLGRYVLVVVGAGIIQFFVILPAVLLLRGLNPLRVLRTMTPAVLMALFTKSSAATLPVTIQSAESRQGVRREVARFVLPICTTINMNGCAAFILTTSLFTLQNGGTPITLSVILLWLLVSVVSAIGNAGVPMGCYFLTLSLMSGVGAPVEVLGIILPIYTIIDMLETAENVWSDSCIAAIVDRDVM